MAVYSHTPALDMLPPPTSAGVVGWMRRNLFSSWLSSLFTLGALYFLYQILPPALKWLFVDADWIGTTRDACSLDGACWVFISVRFEQFLFGFYPEAEYWRVVLGFSILAALVAWLLIERTPYKGKVAFLLSSSTPLLLMSSFMAAILVWRRLKPTSGAA